MTAATAQEATPSAEGAPPEELRYWQYYQDIQTIEPGQSRYLDFLLTPPVLDKAAINLADLRLRDSRDREIPFALRIRHSEQQLTTLEFKEFNHARLPDRADELTLDFGAGPVEHNEMILATSGTNFRRRVQLEGSDDREQWKMLEGKGQVARYEAEGHTLDFRRLRYSNSRFRYLRVRVQPDPLIADDLPTIQSVTMNQKRDVPGEYQTLAASIIRPREPVKTSLGYGTAWTIDLGNEVPFEKLSFTIGDVDFVRDYQLEVLEVGDAGGDDWRARSGPRDRPYAPNAMEGNVPYYQVSGVVASGQWRRRAGTEQKPMDIRFGNEIRARRLKLIVTDNRNPPLNIQGVQYSAAARQVIFERPKDLTEPLRLWFGNPLATPPAYDFARNLPASLGSPPQRIVLAQGVRDNPDYRPTPKPWTDRWPWAIYVVLGIASAALLAILGMLARQTIARHDAASPSAVNP